MARRAWLAAACALAFASRAAALDAAPLRILVSLEAEGLEAGGASMGNPDPIEPYRGSLEGELCVAYPTALVLRGSASGDESLRDEAARKRCALVLSARLTERADIDLATWRYLYPLGQAGDECPGSFEKRKASRGDLAAGFWAETAASLPIAAASLRPQRIVVAGKPGLRVTGLGDPITIPAAGELEIPIGLPAFVEWRASSPQSLDESGSTFIASPGARLEIPFRPLPAWYLDFGLFGLSFPEARAGLLVGRRFFAAAALREFFAGLVLADYSGPPPRPSLIADESALGASLGMGYFLMDPSRPGRVYLAAETALRLEVPKSGGLALDPSKGVSLIPVLGIEWGASTRGKLFAELGCAAYPLDSWRLEFPSPRLGWRIYR